MTATNECKGGAKGRGGVNVMRYLREHPNLIRLASVTIFTLFWEVFGRRADPLFMTYPSAIALAAVEMMKTGELQEAILLSMIPFMIGLTISLAAGIVIGLLVGQFEFVEWTADDHLRHSRFVALREDKPAQDVRRE